jgi:PncC family amidohydrolase
VLGVRAADLELHGAVSEIVARQMAEGARARFGADWSVGVTGIAGPAGGTPDKPVGLVFIAVSGASGTVVSRNQFSGDRLAIKQQSAKRALEVLLEQLG